MGWRSVGWGCGGATLCILSKGVGGLRAFSTHPPHHHLVLNNVCGGRIIGPCSGNPNGRGYVHTFFQFGVSQVNVVFPIYVLPCLSQTKSAARANPPPPLYKLRQSPKLIRSLRLL